MTHKRWGDLRISGIVEDISQPSDKILVRVSFVESRYNPQGLSHPARNAFGVMYPKDRALSTSFVKNSESVPVYLIVITRN